MKRAYVQYLFALLLFGSNGVVASQISLSSYEIVLLRTLIGSLLLAGIFFLSKGKLTFWRDKKQALFLAVSGAAMGASWMLLYEAYREVGVGVASLAYYCGPVIVMALSPLVFGEKLTRPKVLGFLAVLCGIFLVNGGAAQSGKSAWGLLCGGMSAVMFAVMVICNKKAKDITGLENAMLQLVGAFVTVAVFVGLKQGYAIPITGGDWLPVLTLSMVNTGVGCYLYFSAIGRLPVQTVAITGYLEPLAAVVFSVLLLGEQLRGLQVLGGLLIVGGAVVGEWLGTRRVSALPGEVEKG